MLAELVAELVRRAPMPAVGVSVFDRRGVLAETVHGTADLSTGRRVEPGAWWDLASLTKVLVTLPEALSLGVGPDEPIAAFWPRAAGRPVGRATLTDLLSHRAGLPATARFFETLSGADAIVDAALRVPLAPGGAAVYSDLGFILVGALVEDLTATPLAELARRRTGFAMGSVRAADAVATEHCPWRGRLIVGEVHDENAAAMGGPAGHAGAFGTLPLVTAAARDWLAERVVSPAAHRAARECRATNDAGERFGLGWWLTPTRGLGGPLAGPDGYGASGFVGNRIWLEPADGYGVVVLSNRIHPVRGDRAPFAGWCDELLTGVGKILRRAA